MIARPRPCRHVRATDAYLNPTLPKFKGSVRLDFEGSPGTDIIRESFLDTDEGIKTIMWTPEEAGEVRVIVDESTGRHGVCNRSSSSQNHPRNHPLGDLGVRSELSCGCGSVADNFKFTRDIGYLDFCCVADRSNLLTPTSWLASQRQTERFNREGQFVSFVGYE